jgi:hypothetical protein
LDAQPTPDHVIGAMRVMTMNGMMFFHVTNRPTPFANLDNDLDPLLEQLHAAKLLAGLVDAGPNITRYYPIPAQPGEPILHLMEVGVPAPPGTRPAGEAQVKTLPPFPCASILLWGNLAHIVQGYEALTQAVLAAGLERTGECREWNYYVEDGGWTSGDNLIGIYMGIRS